MPKGQTWRPQRECAGLLGLALAPTTPEEQGDAEDGTQGHRPDEHVWHTRECWWKTLTTADLLLQLPSSLP